MTLLPEHDHYNRLLQFEMAHRRRLGRPRIVQYLINRRYYYGDNNQPDDVNQPLGIRYVPRVVNKHVHYLFGEWENDIVDWVVSPLERDDEEEQDTAANISRAIYQVMRRADADTLLYRGALDGSIYGDSVFKLRYSHELGGATFETVLPEYYHAMWHPLNVSHTTEAIIAYNLDRTIAHRMFGTIGNPRYHNRMSLLDPGFAVVWEHWTPWDYHLVVDDEMVSEGPNPYAPIPRPGEEPRPAWLPLLHIANQSVNGEYYGFGDAEPIMELQDELNMRIADFGDIINYHAHPITVVNNYFGRFEDLKTGPDVVWDMGREGEAKYLEWDGPAPGVMEYIELLMKVIFDTSSLTGVAFGRSEQSQASGSALVVQMLPVVEIVRRKRAVWGPVLRKLAGQMLELEAMSMTPAAFKKTYKFSPQDLSRFEITAKWAPILPRDRMNVVNENVALLVNKARSVVTALKDLGTDDPEEERERIIKDLKEFADIELQMQKDLMSAEADLMVPSPTISPKVKNAMPNRNGGKNSDRNTGGSVGD